MNLNLNLANLDPDLVRELIAHDKWKLQETHRHQKEMLALRLQDQTSPDNFNSETSFGICGPKENGLICPDRVREGAREYTKTVPGISDPELYTDLITVSWCGKRLGRWPSARDSRESLNSLRQSFTDLVDRHGCSVVSEAISLIPDFDGRIVQEQIDELESLEKSRVGNSPLFTEFFKKYPNIDKDLMEKCYDKNRGEFVKSGILLLRREFQNTPPEEFSDHPDWRKSWPQHLPRYLKLWQDDLRRMESRMRIAQKAWRESIS